MEKRDQKTLGCWRSVVKKCYGGENKNWKSKNFEAKGGNAMKRRKIIFCILFFLANALSSSVSAKNQNSCCAMLFPLDLGKDVAKGGKKLFQKYSLKKHGKQPRGKNNSGKRIGK